MTLVLAVSTFTTSGAQAAPASAGHRATTMSRSTAHAVLERFAAALTTKPATGSRTTPTPYRDLTSLLVELQHAMGSMTRSDQRRATALRASLNIPQPQASCTAPFLQSVIVSKHFCVHYNSGATDAQAQLTSDTLEHVYSYEVGTLGYHAPLNDGDGRTDVTLQNIGGQGYYGACEPASDAIKTGASCILDNDFSEAEFHAPPLNSLEVTAAHEFFHAIQFGYDSYQQRWLLEGSAVWMEDQVYPAVNDYLQYVRAGGAIVNPRVPIDTDSQSQWYAATLFWKFLSESLHDPGIIRDIWNAASNDTDRTALQDVVRVLSLHKISFGPKFARFGVWNTLPPNTYVDRALYPAPAFWATIDLGRSARDSGSQKLTLSHLTNGSLRVLPRSNLPAKTRLRVSVDGPGSSASQATVQLRLRNGKVTVYTIALNRSGNGSRTLSFNPKTVKSAILIATNASTGGATEVFHLRAQALVP
ncbi:MAG: hypothetical protein JWP74_2924 [Marmoricola sp.]|nr:hypothetical protein [Marmoricola sp.]